MCDLLLARFIFSIKNTNKKNVKKSIEIEKFNKMLSNFMCFLSDWCGDGARDGY